MITLVCNAAEASLDIVLGRGTEILVARQWDMASRATETLAPGLKTLFDEYALAPTHIDRMACVRGPGSFTGIRLVLTTAAAFRRALGIPVAGLDCMQALAVRAQRAYPEAVRVGVVTHARRDVVHYQAFACGRDHALPIAMNPVALLTPHDVVQQRIRDNIHALIGSGLARHTAFGTLDIPVCPDNQPAPEDLWVLAQHATYAHADIEPLYVRPCDAVVLCRA